jgi:uncharacterized protein YndB with AHSA1/START domain
MSTMRSRLASRQRVRHKISFLISADRAGGQGKTTDVGEVLEADPPRRLSYTFHGILNEAALKERPSRVTFVLEPHGELVKLTRPRSRPA